MEKFLDKIICDRCEEVLRAIPGQPVELNDRYAAWRKNVWNGIANAAKLPVCRRLDPVLFSHFYVPEKCLSIAVSGIFVPSETEQKRIRPYTSADRNI